MTYLTKFKIHFEDESDITLLELPAILNNNLHFNIKEQKNNIFYIY